MIPNGAIRLLNDKEYPRIKCPVCDSDNFLAITWKREAGVEYAVGLACTNCDSQFTFNIKCHKYNGEWTNIRDIDLHSEGFGGL